jgi:ABC-type nitrate/sulfonate/bicarbonate transport system permease component
MVLSQTVPIIAIAPVIAIWFGIGIVSKLIICILVVFFPVALNLTEGLNSYDKDLEELLKCMNASKLQIFTKLKLPTALDYFFSGLKIAATYSIMGAVIGEWLGARAGLGIFMTRVMSSHRADMLFAAIVVIVVLSVAMFKLIEITEKIAVPWNSND